MIKSYIRYLVLISVFTVSCQKIFFNEDLSTRELSFADFHAVKISGIYNIVLIQDSANRLVITGKNDINSIDAVIINDTLIIDDHKKMFFNPYKNTLALHFSNLEYMVTIDPVNVSNTDTIKADKFLYEAIGEIAEVRLVVKCNYLLIVNSANTLGYFYLYGKANDCTLFNRYGCSIFADNLSCKNAEIVNESVGDVYINSSENIKAFIWGPGNIYYHGTPVIEIAEKRGKGRIIRLN
jgi:hypothetical protein